MRNFITTILMALAFVFTISSCSTDYIEPELEKTQNTFVYSPDHILYFSSEFINETSDGFETIIICNGKGHDYYNCSACCKPIKITISKEAALKIDNSIQAVDSFRNSLVDTCYNDTIFNYIEFPDTLIENNLVISTCVMKGYTPDDLLKLCDEINKNTLPITMYWNLPNIDDNFNKLTLIGGLCQYYKIKLYIRFNTDYSQEDGHYHSYKGNDDIFGNYHYISLTDEFLNSLHNYCRHECLQDIHYSNKDI